MRILPVLIDFDGVIRLEGKIAPGTERFFAYLSGNKIPFFIISNSTRYTGNEIKNFLISSGISVTVNAMTTIDATLDYLSKTGKKVSIYCKEDIKKYFSSFISDDKPEAVVIGDLEEGWTYDILNEIFRKVHEGASIIAMQKNKFWKPAGKKLSLDAGAFIAAIEYATSKEAVLIGKPSRMYFDTALRAMGYGDGNNFIMIGDDINTDIIGAQKMGATGILLFSGKTNKYYKSSSPVFADYECDNLTQAIELLEGILS